MTLAVFRMSGNFLVSKTRFISSHNGIVIGFFADFNIFVGMLLGHVAFLSLKYLIVVGGDRNIVLQF